jgi:hypothetical protein
MNKIIRNGFYGLAGMLLLAACGQAHITPAHESARALATSSSVRQVENTGEQMLAKAGVPVHGTAMQQLSFAKSMLAKPDRQALAKKLAIPEGNRSAFEAGLLAAAEHDHVATRAGRDRFLLTDLPLLIREYQ